MGVRKIPKLKRRLLAAGNARQDLCSNLRFGLPSESFFWNFARRKNVRENSFIFKKVGMWRKKIWKNVIFRKCCFSNCYFCKMLVSGWKNVIFQKKLECAWKNVVLTPFKQTKSHSRTFLNFRGSKKSLPKILAYYKRVKKHMYECWSIFAKPQLSIITETFFWSAWCHF